LANYPARSQVLNEIVARLGNITATNGYFSAEPNVEESTLTFDTGDYLPLIQVAWGGHTATRNKYGMIETFSSYNVQVQDVTQDGGETPTRLADKLTADVVTALNRSTIDPLVSGAQSVNLGGPVTEFVLTEAIPAIGEGNRPRVFVLLEFQARWDADLGDEFTVNGSVEPIP